MSKKGSPNFVVVGAAKAGTTSIYAYLSQHPQVYLSPIKETNYFAKDIPLDKIRKDYYKGGSLDVGAYVETDLSEQIHIAFVSEWEHYQKLYKNVKEELAIGEISNSYLHSEVAAEEIYKANPDMKIIMILRDPIRRAFSHYKMTLRVGLVKGSFYEEVQKDYKTAEKGFRVSHLYVEMGQYLQQVQRYLSVFPKEQVKVYFFDDMREDVGGLIDDMLSFLGVDTTLSVDTSFQVNKASVPKNPGIVHFLRKSGIRKIAKNLAPSFIGEYAKKIFYKEKDDLKLTQREIDLLRPIYEKEVQALGKLLNRDLSHWLS
ncbi:MAG: hypothetical protein ACI959_002027 [Limisphaerales bacterium]